MQGTVESSDDTLTRDKASHWLPVLQMPVNFGHDITKLNFTGPVPQGADIEYLNVPFTKT